MARFISKDGARTVETTNAVERVRLLAQGYVEDKPASKAAAAKPSTPKTTPTPATK